MAVNENEFTVTNARILRGRQLLSLAQQSQVIARTRKRPQGMGSERDVTEDRGQIAV